MPTTSILTLCVTLNGTRPEVWRTIIIREDLPLTQLHDRIQGAMGWEDSHLHSFKIRETEYLDHKLWDDHMGASDENRMTLKKAKLEVGDTFQYVYDMGDNWTHTIKVMERRMIARERARSWVEDGANACPPEDCGGVGGYLNFLVALANPNDEEHEEYMEWRGEDFDPTLFDVRAARRILWMLDYYGKGYPWEDQ